MPIDSRPLLAYVVQPGLRPRYGVYTDAYGLEMTFDDDWDVDVVIFSKPKLIEHIATETGIHQSPSISLGLTRRPSDDSNEYATWQLVDLTRRLARKQTSPDLKPLIVARSVDDVEKWTAAHPELRDREFAVSLRMAHNRGDDERAIRACRSMLDAGFAGQYRMLLYSTTTPESLLGSLPIEGADGVFSPGSEYVEMLPLMSTASRSFGAREHGG